MERKLKKFLLSSKLFKFLTVGALSTVLNYTVFYVLLRFCTVNYKLAAATGFILGVLLGYWLNKNWSFGIQAKSGLRYFYKYCIIYGLTLIAGIYLLQFLVERCSVLPLQANIVTICFTTLCNFIGVKYWAFKINKVYA